VDKKTYYCKLIHDAVSGPGTNDDELIRTLVSLKHHDVIKKAVMKFVDSYGYALDLTSELEAEFSTPTLKEIAETYERMYNESLLKAVGGDVSGKYGKLIIGLCKSPLCVREEGGVVPELGVGGLIVSDQGDRDAEYIHEACVGLGTNDSKLIEIMVTRSVAERVQIDQAYTTKYGKTLSEEIKSETSFNYKAVLVALGTVFSQSCRCEKLLG